LPKLLFLVTEDWYFCSHRMVLACEAKRQGYDVVVATRIKKHRDRILSAGLKLIPISMLRNGRNPWTEFLSICELVRVYRSERPDIVHHIAIKPAVYGALAARISGIPKVVNAIAGMGHVFASRSWKARILQLMLTCAMRILLNRPNSRIILQNPDDLSMLVEAGVADPERTDLILGSGVDVEEFQHFPEPDGDTTVMMSSRMLWDKGVGEFVEAARRLKSEGIRARFVLVGDSDTENPGTVPGSRLKAWNDEGAIEWWGHRNDMPAVLAQANIVCLPSYYREGIPKSLIEAASCGRPIVTTDSPGCREIVRDGENGFLVPVRDSAALAAAIKKLTDDPPLRRRFGARGRELVVKRFSLEKVIADTLAVYRRLAT
jgi:glycosyltransferase involved in cell wall biosynthesis